MTSAGSVLFRAVLHSSVLDPSTAHAVASLQTVQRAVWRAVDDIGSLAGGLRRAVSAYADAESEVGGLFRGVVAVTSDLLGESALAFPVLGLAAAEVLVIGELLSPSTLADQRGSVAMLGAASFLRAAKPGLQIPSLDPVPSVARDVATLLPAAGPTVTIARADPPQLPVPRSVSDVIANIGRTYDGSTATGVAGTPKGVISLQRLTHPDGTRAWVVEIPGTQEWTPNTSNPMDMTTNLRLMAGLPDDLSTAVVHAMASAGVGADEPVMFAGHSQGGMAAMAAAALVAPAYTVRAVVTAGSPDIPRAVPAEVQVRHYAHDEDLIPQVDGAGDRRSTSETVVHRDLGRTGAPATPAQAHSIERYAQTAQDAQRALADDPFMTPFDDAASSVLGPPGTTAVTLQYQTTRDPGVVGSVQPTISQG